MTQVIFIGATGTDIGKTYVTCLLLRQLQEQGYKVHAIKPVISGFDEDNIADSDTGRILTTMGLETDLANAERISPWRYKNPLPPHLVALQTARPIVFDRLVQYCQQQTAEKPDFLLIEGAGGIMTPLDYDHTTLDLVTHLDCSCLLVAGSYLGTISHSLTALTCLRQRDIDIKGLIISQSPQDYTDFDMVRQDFTKIIPDLAITTIGRHDQTTDLSALVI